MSDKDKSAMEAASGTFPNKNRDKNDGDNLSDISPSSGVSSASGSIKSASIKPSGIRPPSRIGRPCGGLQKPAIPATPTKNSSDDWVKRITNDYGRHKLTDLMEADESEEDVLDYLRPSSRRQRASLGSTASSMDYLWELHPRRLSEAGLSRHSDSSAVLTEDTDSFIIGQKVWVGGNKPGTIAYIGETQFAPGDWAGIVLDEPIGKNDGSVAGTRYFQCEPKKGVFSRLTRLSRVPIEQPGMGSSDTFTQSFMATPPPRKSPTSPTGSSRSLLKSPVSLTGSNTSLNSAATHVDFKVGDRVIIKSSQGSKIGTVRYMGLTDFAPGEWVGVDLDEPRGRNDGSVEGKRYFDCRPNFGLFAPISKVSKSPSKYKPGACAVHSGAGGLPPSGLKHAYSKESLASKTSIASSVRRVRLGTTGLGLTPKGTPSSRGATPLPTRTALQDVLKEKQQHIEQLLKEQDLERAELIKASHQSEEAEKRFLTLKLEFEQYRNENEIKMKDLIEQLKKSKEERDSVNGLLDDEKRKNEDLLFRFEELEIMKVGDEGVKDKELASKQEIIEHLRKENEEQLKNLTSLSEHIAKLTEENADIKRTIEEYDIVTTQNKSKLDSKTEEFEKILVELVQIQEALNNKTAELSQFEANQTEIKSENTRLKQEISAKINDLETELDKRNGLETELEQREEAIKQLKAEIVLKDQSGVEGLDSLAKEIENLKEKLSQNESLQAQLKVDLLEKSKLLEIARENETRHLEEIKLVQEEKEKLKQDFSKNTEDIQAEFNKKVEELSSQLQLKDGDVSKHLDVVRKLEEEIVGKNSEISNLKSSEDQLKKSETEFKQKTEALQQHIAQIELTMKQNEEGGAVLHKELQIARETITSDKEMIKKLENELVQVRKDFNQTTEEVHQRLTSQVDALVLDLQHKNEEMINKSGQITQLEETLLSKTNQVQNLESTAKSLQENDAKNKEELTNLQKKIGELEVQRKIFDEEVTGKNKQLEESAAKLDAILKEVEAHKKELLQVRQDSGQTNLEIEDKFKKQMSELQADLQQKQTEITTNAEIINKLQEEVKSKEIEITTFESSLKTKEEREEHLRKELEELQSKISDTECKREQEITIKNQQLEEAAVQNKKNAEEIARLKEDLEKIKNDSTKSTEEIEQRLSAEVEALSKEIISKTEESTVYCVEIARLKEELKTNSEKIVTLEHSQHASQETEHSLKHTIESLEETLKNSEDLKNTLNEELLGKNKQLEESSLEIVKNTEVMRNLQDEIAKLRENNQDLEKKLSGQLDALTTEIEHKKEEATQTSTLISHLKDELNVKTKLIENLQTSQTTIQENESELKKKYELLKAKLGEAENAQKRKDAELDSKNKDLSDAVAKVARTLDENKRLEDELSKLKGASNEKQTNGNGNVPTEQHSKLLQDKEDAENQIRFLNSIIVDMQKKNEEQKARIEILESGYSPEMVDELQLLNPSGRQIAPRLYCDICEEFDLHETEDCPRQCSEPVPLSEEEKTQRKASRPYCEICEMFGHATEDCHEDETY